LTLDVACGSTRHLPIVSQTAVAANHQSDESPRRIVGYNKQSCILPLARFNHHEHEIITPRVALCVGFATNIIAQSPTKAPSPAQPPADYDLRWGVKIPMRDKVELNATLYLQRLQMARHRRRQ